MFRTVQSAVASNVDFSTVGSLTLDSDKPSSNIVEIQCLLDNVGASELVIDLIVNTKNDRVFEESILLGIALLQGGNTQIQVANADIQIIYFLPHLSVQIKNRFNFMDFLFITTLSLTQNSFYSQLFKQKKSETFFKVFYDRMRLAQQEIRSTVSVNMFELSTRKKDDDGDVSSTRSKKGTVT